MPTSVSLPGRHHEHDATWRALAHRLEPYSPKLVDEGPLGSILLIPSTLSPLTLEGVAEALRSHSRRSQRVLELYSLLALNLVRDPASSTSSSSVPPHVLVGSWCELLARESMQRVQRNREQAEHAAHMNFVEHSFHALG